MDSEKKLDKILERWDRTCVRIQRKVVVEITRQLVSAEWTIIQLKREIAELRGEQSYW